MQPGSRVPRSDGVGQIGAAVRQRTFVQGIRGGYFAPPVSVGGGAEASHRRGQPSGYAFRIAYLADALAQSEPGGLHGVLALLRGEAVLVADGVEQAAVSLGDLCEVQFTRGRRGHRQTAV